MSPTKNLKLSCIYALSDHRRNRAFYLIKQIFGIYIIKQHKGWCDHDERDDMTAMKHG